MFGSLYDKLYIVAFVLTIFTLVHGFIKIEGLNIYNDDQQLSGDQADRLIMGAFHILLSVICVCFLL